MVQLIAAAGRTTETLTAERLLSWHQALLTGHRDLRVGQWRSDTVRVISRRGERTILHFEAPPADRVPSEIAQFLSWWHGDSQNLDGLMRAALTHLWFVTIHPFEDGNGRLARALTDFAIADDLGDGLRCLSLSPEVLAQRSSYYDVLKAVQHGDGDCTAWFLSPAP